MYVADLDGTLLWRDAQLSSYERDVLVGLLAQNVAFTGARARALPAIGSALAALRIRLPVVEFRGVQVSGLGSGRHLVAHLLDRGAAAAAVDMLCRSSYQSLVVTLPPGLAQLYYEHPRAG